MARPNASWHEIDAAPAGPMTHIRPAPVLAHQPAARRGMAGSMPLGQTKRLSGARSGVPQTSDSSDIGEAAGGAAQAAASGYSATGGGAGTTSATTTAAATSTAVAPATDAAPAASGGSAAGVPTAPLGPGGPLSPTLGASGLDTGRPIISGYLGSLGTPNTSGIPDTVEGLAGTGPAAATSHATLAI